ncbi:hypothetical protein BDK51DRAFT_26362 [Blyttiomyces helicus]|uniref:Uncharacterized protein n=1 Tax=Blyttiomyces helicus TaxID=388810 RepID=A0A4P9WL62_9FUNG|nr:hypothetical protein BDK51DRAFT_26362 [Blyttiomyces helicus]|eukprot:RKO92895.1 hypothetical protein BDK51DRAFT_26362 [Blyttiomyces helicus]
MRACLIVSEQEQNPGAVKELSCISGYKEKALVSRICARRPNIDPLRQHDPFPLNRGARKRDDSAREERLTTDTVEHKKRKSILNTEGGRCAAFRQRTTKPGRQPPVGSNIEAAPWSAPTNQEEPPSGRAPLPNQPMAIACGVVNVNQWCLYSTVGAAERRRSREGEEEGASALWIASDPRKHEGEKTRVEAKWRHVASAPSRTCAHISRRRKRSPTRPPTRIKPPQRFLHQRTPYLSEPRALRLEKEKNIQKHDRATKGKTPRGLQGAWRKCARVEWNAEGEERREGSLTQGGRSGARRRWGVFASPDRPRFANAETKGKAAAALAAPAAAKKGTIRAKKQGKPKASSSKASCLQASSSGDTYSLNTSSRETSATTSDNSSHGKNWTEGESDDFIESVQSDAHSPQAGPGEHARHLAVYACRVGLLSAGHLTPGRGVGPGERGVAMGTQCRERWRQAPEEAATVEGGVEGVVHAGGQVLTTHPAKRGKLLPAHTETFKHIIDSNSTRAPCITGQAPWFYHIPAEKREFLREIKGTVKPVFEALKPVLEHKASTDPPFLITTPMGGDSPVTVIFLDSAYGDDATSAPVDLFKSSKKTNKRKKRDKEAESGV